MHLRSLRKLHSSLILAVLAVASFEGCAEPGNLEKVEFHEASVEEVIEFFRSGAGRGGKTRNILVDPKINKDAKVTMTLHDVAEGVAFAYAAEIAGFDYREDKHALRIFPLRGRPAVKAFLKRGSAITMRRASEIRMPTVDFDGTELGQAVNDIAAASRVLDPKKKGLNILLGHGVDPATPVTFRLRDVPISTVLNYVAEFTGHKLRADGSAIVFTARPKEKP